MMGHPQFKDRVNALLEEFDLVWVPKRIPDFYGDG
jgi:hypothetical protein